MFYGQRLTQLRLLHELSRSDLANDIGVTEQAIWQFERDEVSPSLSVQIQLASRFNVRLSFFSETVGDNQIDVSAIAFRNADSISRKVISFQEAYLQTISNYISDLESFVQFPEQVIFKLADETNRLYQTGETLENIAAHARRELGIALDNSDVLYKLEKSGIYILEKQLRGTEDAYSTWTRKNVPFIILGMGKTAVRRNFDLAHELGHLLLHREVDFENLDKYDMLAKESEANRFASSFLLPEDSFRKDMETFVKHRVSHPDSYVILKERYHVSIQAMAYRAYQLQLMTKSQYSYFYRILSKKGYRLREPLDDLVVKRPTKLRSMFRVVFEHQVISLHDFLRLRQINLGFLAHLFQIEETFFETYWQSSQDFHLDNILDLSHYRHKKSM